MARVKAGTKTRARHKKIIKLAKGFRGRAKNCFRIAIEKVEKALQYAYRDRRTRKRDLRSLWIQRINAAARHHGLTYSQLIHALAVANISVDRKILADMAVNNSGDFAQLVAQAKQHLATKSA
jgi:large subunit ribosomal protein L20